MTRRQDKKHEKLLKGHAEKPYVIGYGKPPVESRFKPGQSGNPWGRPKGARDPDSVLRRVLDREISATVDDETRTLPIRDALVVRALDLAKSGDPKALEWALAMSRRIPALRPTKSPEEERASKQWFLDILKAKARRIVEIERESRSEAEDE